MSSHFSLSRRTFLGAAASATAAGVLPPPVLAQATPSKPGLALPERGPLWKNGNWRTPARAIRGVNLGAWLVLEKWMTPSLFASTTARDEWGLWQVADAAKRIEAHRESWITEDDFRWVRSVGLDAVRLPIGYWALQDRTPFRSSAKWVDAAFEWARKHDLQVLLDLHALPGSQNGWDHSGREGAIEWTKPENRALSLQVLEDLARRYGKHPNLWGFELANEPRHQVPLDFLKAFYRESYARLRPLLPERVAIVVHDGFRPNSWLEVLSGDAYQNCVLDTHIYQAYTDEDKKRTPAGHVQFALERAKDLDEVKSQLWTIVGEWSIAIAWDSIKGQPPLVFEATRRGYASAQLLNFDRTHGWFYWSLKTETGGEWSLQDCVRKGWMPSSFASPGA